MGFRWSALMITSSLVLISFADHSDFDSLSRDNDVVDPDV